MAENENVIDLSVLLRPYKGKWVVISEDKSRVLVSADTMEEALRRAEEHKNHPILLRVPDEHTAQLL
ncbi:MAG: hypothetical protein HY695_03050 [Deltaproteobacteria bacterium]|nr:hypothetical protein [Deltaproteobacteria bacterium]